MSYNKEPEGVKNNPGSDENDYIQTEINEALTREPNIDEEISVKKEESDFEPILQPTAAPTNFNPFVTLDRVVASFFRQQSGNGPISPAAFQEFLSYEHNTSSEFQHNLSGLTDAEVSVLFNDAINRLNAGRTAFAKRSIPSRPPAARKSAPSRPTTTARKSAPSRPTTAARKSAPMPQFSENQEQDYNAGLDDIAAIHSALYKSSYTHQPGFDMNGGYDEEAAMHNAIINSQHDPILISNTMTTSPQLQFMEITNASIQDARKYLKIADNQLDQAVQLYFINASENPLLVQNEAERQNTVEPHHLVQLADDNYQFVGDLSTRIEDWPSFESDEEELQPQQTARKQAPRQPQQQTARKSTKTVAKVTRTPRRPRRPSATKSAQRITRQSFLSSSSSEPEQEPQPKRKTREPYRTPKRAKTTPEPVARESTIPADVKPPPLFQGLVLTPNLAWQRTSNKAPKSINSSPSKANVQIIPNNTAARKSAPFDDSMAIDELAKIRRKRQIAQPMEINEELGSLSEMESGEAERPSMPEDVYERHRKPKES